LITVIAIKKHKVDYSNIMSSIKSYLNDRFRKKSTFQSVYKTELKIFNNYVSVHLRELTAQ